MEAVMRAKSAVHLLCHTFDLTWFVSSFALPLCTQCDFWCHPRVAWTLWALQRNVLDFKASSVAVYTESKGWWLWMPICPQQCKGSWIGCSVIFVRMSNYAFVKPNGRVAFGCPVLHPYYLCRCSLSRSMQAVPKLRTDTGTSAINIQVLY